MFGNIMAARHAISKQREDTGSMHCNVTTTGPSTKLLLSKNKNHLQSAVTHKI
jgi:hypothetical protein